MTTAAGDPVFLDTNVVAYASVPESPFHTAEDGPAVTGHLLDLIAQYAIGGKQIHDANIVATMRAYSITRLLTHNTNDFARYAGLITVLPLVATR